MALSDGGWTAKLARGLAVGLSLDDEDEEAVVMDEAAAQGSLTKTVSFASRVPTVSQSAAPRQECFEWFARR